MSWKLEDSIHSLWVHNITIIIQVNINGVLSFRSPFDTFTPVTFPLTDFAILITPFWDDISTKVNGNIFFRFTANPALLNQVESFSREVFGSEMDPLLLFIVTWDAVAGASFRNQVYASSIHTVGSFLLNSAKDIFSVYLNFL